MNGKTGIRQRRIVVSLHDVAPPFKADIQNQLEALETLGVSTVVLKVVPNWHGRHLVSADAGFCAMLRTAADHGAQLVLHGYEHRPLGTWRGSPLRQMRARVFAPQAAEFMTLTGSEARAAIGAGVAAFKSADLPEPTTFCAPGWLMTDECEDAIGESGIRYVTGMFSLLDLGSRSLTWMRAEGYIGGGSWQQTGIGALGGIVRRGCPSCRVSKLFLHPDPSGRQRWAPAVERVRAYLAAGWLPATFADLTAATDDSNHGG